MLGLISPTDTGGVRETIIIPPNLKTTISLTCQTRVSR
jgi:hypothetical protein